MLGRLEMSTEEALEAYDSFASKIFSKANKNKFNLTERYGAVALEQTVQQLVEDQSKGRPLMRDSRPNHAKGRAFVCTMPLQDRNTTVRLRTYDVEGDRFPKCKVYEAARATTAASTYFKPMILKDNQGMEQEFVDAALGRNNPINVLPEEAISLFGTQRRLGCVVSLGTGSRKAELVQARAVREMGKQIVSLLKVMKEFTTDTRRDHEQMEMKFNNFPGVYFRFDVEGGAEGISLDEWKKIGKLKERTRLYLQSAKVSAHIDELAETLLHGNQHGLSLAHFGGLNKDAIVRDTQVVKPRGRASTIFTGREAILGKIRTYFRRHEYGDISRKEFHIWGMGGVGKTQIALKFAEECEQQNYQIFWIDATDVVTIQQSYRRIAQRLLPDADQEGSGAIQKVLAKLETSDNWLLVFDNAPDRGLAQYTPDGNRGNIFYTSRHKHLERRMPPGCDINVNEMEAEDAVTLLLRSARLDADDSAYRATAEPIAEELGYLPLAIDQAGAYIYMAPCPIEQFLLKFNGQKETLLKDPEFRGEDNSRNLPIYTTFNISYEAIKAFANKKSDPHRALKATYALQLLSLICFYHNEGFFGAIFGHAAVVRSVSEMSSWHPLVAEGTSLDHFVLGSEDGNPDGLEWQSQNFQLGMAFLEEFSLISYDYGSMYSNMHVLVHDWARARMETQQRAEWGLAARFILLDSMNPRNTRELIIHRRDLIPHLDACRRFVQGYSDDLGLESQYHCRIATAYEEADRIEEAGAAHLEAITYAQKISGFLDEDMLDLMTVLARFAKRNGYEDIAEETWLEVIDRRTLMNDEKIWRAAEKKSRQEPSLKAPGVVHNHGNREALDDSRLRDDKVSLAAMYIYQSRFEDAQKHIQDILEWDRRRARTADDDEDIHVARARDLISADLGRKEARITIQQAQERYLEAKESLGPDDRETIKRWKVLAERLQDERMLKDAEKHFDDIFQWHMQTHGKSASETLEAWLRLSRNLYLQRRPIEAMLIQNVVLGRYQERLGQLHPKTLRCRQQLALASMEAGFHAMAIAHCIKCVDGYTVLLGVEHRVTRHAAHSLRQFRETLKTTPLFLRISLIQEMMRNSQVALEGDPRMPPWLAEWEPKPLEVMLNAEGDMVPFALDCIQVEEGEINTWRQLEEAAYVPTQTLEMIVPPVFAGLLVGEGAPWNFEDGTVEGNEEGRLHLDIDQAASTLENMQRAEQN
ncbi:hypothetical protein VSDG_02235 [Cytospora chrysosperma]|uniref:Uncharacterized protein n=1 Tax=Cytospora chrysosperma TaxID=252740 RepID=A0A423WDU4_CYTCH|nr:hypothetical protein VSDG_02235 [Valsa sordida]